MPWDIAGKTVLVTGATSGIGLEASVELARRGARVVMVGRDGPRTDAARADVVARSGFNDVSALLCDFSSQAAIRALAQSFRERHGALHVLVLFANELARRLEGTGVTSNSLHPGAVATNIWSGAPSWAKPIIAVLFRPFFINAEKGGLTIVQLAAEPGLEGVTGRYFEEGEEMDPAPLARDEPLARRLWDVSAALVGLA